MRTTKYFLVRPEIAQRAGVADVRFRTQDGKMILSEQDIRSVRLEPEEYLNGVVEDVLTEEQANILIAEGGKQLGLLADNHDETSIENDEISTENDEINIEHITEEDPSDE